MKKTFLLMFILSFFAAVNTYVGASEKEGKYDPEITYESFKGTLDKHFQANPELFDSSKGKDIIVLLGKTGAGKSTLINYLGGKKLRVDEEGDIVLENSEDKSAMSIGTGADSCTFLPKFINIDGLLFYDLPGLHDSKGSLYELVNASFIRRIIENSRTTRFVFVAKLAEAEVERGRPFTDLVSKAKNLVPGVDVSKSSSLVLMKSDEDNLMRFLTKKVSPENLRPWVLSSEEYRISKMSKAHKGKEIDLNEKKPIMSTIESAKPLLTPKIDIKKLCGPEVISRVKDIFQKEVETFIGKQEQDIHRQISGVKYRGSLEELEKSLKTLKHIESKLESDLSYDSLEKSSKLIELLKPFLSEDEYKRISSQPIESTKKRLLDKIADKLTIIEREIYILKNPPKPIVVYLPAPTSDVVYIRHINSGQYLFAADDRSLAHGDYDVRTHRFPEGRNKWKISSGIIQHINSGQYLFAADDRSLAHGDYDVRTHKFQEGRNKWEIVPAG